MFCSNCGNKLNYVAKFCSSCGSAASGAAQNATKDFSHASKTQKSSKTIRKHLTQVSDYHAEEHHLSKKIKSFFKFFIIASGIGVYILLKKISLDYDMEHNGLMMFITGALAIISLGVGYYIVDKFLK